MAASDGSEATAQLGENRPKKKPRAHQQRKHGHPATPSPARSQSSSVAIAVDFKTFFPLHSLQVAVVFYPNIPSHSNREKPPFDYEKYCCAAGQADRRYVPLAGAFAAAAASEGTLFPPPEGAEVSTTGVLLLQPMMADRTRCRSLYSALEFHSNNTLFCFQIGWVDRCLFFIFCCCCGAGLILFFFGASPRWFSERRTKQAVLCVIGFVLVLCDRLFDRRQQRKQHWYVTEREKPTLLARLGSSSGISKTEVS